MADTIPHGRVFSSATAKGGCTLEPSKAALVMIEFQNEFTTEGGKLHDSVKKVMEETDMLKKTGVVKELCKAKGIKCIYAPISFDPSSEDNPNKGLGILKGCSDGQLFLKDTWNTKIYEPLLPKDDDIIVKGKKGLDAFPGTDLEKHLVDHGIETVILCGFLTNCCVESTMRTAYEKGFNVITLKDCCATQSTEAHHAATEGTFGMFSTPMTADDFAKLI